MTTTKTLRYALVAAGLVLGTANAQAQTDTSSTGTDTNMSRTHTDDGRGVDYGWLGLIGLAGLLGLRRRNVVTDTRSDTRASRV
jgi:MYXO-CTERM domain-containing protein